MKSPFERTEKTLELLLSDRAKRIDALDYNNQIFQIGAKTEFGLLIVTAYREGFPIPGSDGLILEKRQALDWILDASIMATGQVCRDTQNTIFEGGASEFPNF